MTVRIRAILAFIVHIVLCLGLFGAEAAPPGKHGPRSAMGTHASKPSAASHAPLEPRDNWFSYEPIPLAQNRPTGLYLQSPAHDVTTPPFTRFDHVAEEIVITSERQRRDFMLVRPDDELTGPRALDAFQPYVPLPGATCTYKNICYDLSQPPLRETLPKLARLLFGD